MIRLGPNTYPSLHPVIATDFDNPLMTNVLLKISWDKLAILMEGAS